MKFFWKICFVFISLIAVVFSVFGIFMVTQNFRNSMDKAIDEGVRENRMFHLAFEVNMHSLSEHYRTQEIVTALSETVINNLDNQEYSYKIYRGRTLLYENMDLVLEHDLFSQMGENNCVYQVMESGEDRYLIFMCKTSLSGRTYYLESAKNITYIYEERASFYDTYRAVMLSLIGVSAVIVLVLSHFLTKSVVQLSNTTRKFAQGDYDVRAEVSSEDEIGTLAKDFNQMADSLVQKMDELKENARKQEDFTASFAHELKTPLTAIIGYADMLRTMEMSKEETMEASNYIYSQGKRLESLSFKLLELIVTQNQTYQFKELESVELLDELKQIVSNSLEAKKITLLHEVQEGCVYGEHDLIMSLLVNLVDNARKALSEGGTIILEGRCQGDGYEFVVTDNGCGMPKEELDKITEAFYMVDKSRSRKEGGAGLGMTLCSRIVEVHGAKWYIRSKVNEGTSVRVVFPGREAVNEE